MKLQEVLAELRRADKVIVRDEDRTKELFCGFVNQCFFEKELLSREVDGFYPETLGGLVVYLKK